MPILRIKDIRSMSSEDRRKRLADIKTELQRLTTMVRAGGTVDNPHRIKELRRAVAKILTIEREQQPSLVTAKRAEKMTTKKPRKKTVGEPEEEKRK